MPQPADPGADFAQSLATQPGVTAPSEDERKRVASQDRMLQFFRYEHLPEHLGSVSEPFGKLAQWLVANLPANPERTVALRKLLEAKDAAVRARLYEG